MNVFSFEWIKGSDYAGVTVPSGTAMKSKLLRQAKNNPDEVNIITQNQDGSLFAYIPVNYVKISPPRRVSDEKREVASERFRQMWKNKQESEDTENDI